ncbi:MAG: aminotransferase class I/II-fold pyridoxal phosphate-dependent enzyme [Bacilli bacterium]|nr:MAG: aminotransferase class I/II-fold pyridoxal phosphate-dependent enzyme [Bacilli bacterium]
MFDNVNEDNILIGNGAAELINNLRYIVGKRIGLTIPSFNEYVRCFPDCEITYINSSDDNYRLSLNKIIDKLDDVDTMIIISPDNPSGSCLKYEEVIEILDIAKEKNKQVIFDESFMDFANNNYTLIDDDILNKYSDLDVIKSISKSYGVPGLRLGVLASGNEKYIKTINNNLPVWNINSFC